MSDSMFWNVIEIQFYAWDIFMLSPPWFILILSKTIRKEFFKMLGFKKSKILFVVSTSFKNQTAHSRTASTLKNNWIYIQCRNYPTPYCRILFIITFVRNIYTSRSWCLFKAHVRSFKMTPRSRRMVVPIKSYGEKSI